jgi:hypothetical protein
MKKVSTMDYMIAASALVALIICVAILGIFRGYDVEITFHSPVFVKIKITTKANQPP